MTFSISAICWTWPAKRASEHLNSTETSRIVHDYLGVDEDVVWEVVTGDLPLLVETLERIVPVD